eukprot:9490831-Pyramimonas_sp.AAC.2
MSGGEDRTETPTKRKREETSASVPVVDGGVGEDPMKKAAPRYLLFFEYNGANFSGVQRQAAARTVQGCIEVNKRAPLVVAVVPTLLHDPKPLSLTVCDPGCWGTLAKQHGARRSMQD